MIVPSRWMTKTGQGVPVKWCDDNGYGCENKGNFFAELKSKGIFATSGTVEGKTVKNIVKGYVTETESSTFNKEEQLPFD